MRVPAPQTTPKPSCWHRSRNGPAGRQESASSPNSWRGGAKSTRVWLNCAAAFSRTTAVLNPASDAAACARADFATISASFRTTEIFAQFYAAGRQRLLRQHRGEFARVLPVAAAPGGIPVEKLQGRRYQEVENAFRELRPPLCRCCRHPCIEQIKPVTKLTWLSNEAMAESACAI